MVRWLEEERPPPLHIGGLSDSCSVLSRSPTQAATTVQ